MLEQVFIRKCLANKFYLLNLIMYQLLFRLITDYGIMVLSAIVIIGMLMYIISMIIQNRTAILQYILIMIANPLRCCFALAKKQFMKITPNAQRRIQTLLTKKNDPQIIGVKISLTKKGCNGLSYAMNYVKNSNKFDEVIDKGKYKVILDSKALMTLVGTQMDFVEGQLGSQFVFNNPNEKGRCGCGESFHI